MKWVRGQAGIRWTQSCFPLDLEGTGARSDCAEAARGPQMLRVAGQGQNLKSQMEREGALLVQEQCKCLSQQGALVLQISHPVAIREFDGVESQDLEQG